MARISRPAKKRIAAEFHQLYQDFLTDLPLSRDIVSLHLLQIIYRAVQDIVAGTDAASAGRHDAGSARRTQIMSQAKRVIEEKSQSPIALEDIAAHLDISPYYLCHVFSQESGFTLSHYLREVRMEKAARLLADHRLRVNEIARAVGFSDTVYFRRVFKAYFGASPRAYRSRSID